MWSFLRNNLHSYLRLDLYVFCVTIKIHGYSQLDLCVSFYSCFYAHEVLFWKLQFTRLFAVRFMCCARKFHPFQFQCVCSAYCSYADLTIYEFCNTKRIITVTTIMEDLTNKVLRQWNGLQTRCSSMSKPQKDDDLSDWMGCSVRSKIQKVQRVDQLECSYASFMLSLRYYLCLFYTNYASTKKRCCFVSCLLVYFYLLKEGGQFEQ